MASGRPSRDGTQSAGTLIQLVSISLCLYAITQLSLAAAVNLSTFHIDGAFQTASGLFRLQAGELPGRDFFPYLGTGILLLLYPAFLLFNGDLAASTASAHLMVALSQALSVAVVLYLCVGRRLSWPITLGLMLITLALLLDSPPPLLAERLAPGNSLRPLRSALPYLAALPVYFALARASLRSFVVLGLMAGAAMIWSNDFALPVAFHCGLAALGLMIIGPHWRYRLRGAALFAASFVVGLSPLLLATGGHLLPLLKFNFVDVAGDQWWYFGPWVESCRLYLVTDLPNLVSQDNLLGLFALGAMATGAWMRRTATWFTLLWLGSTLLVGGILASVGGHFGGYFTPFQFWGLMVVAALGIRLTASLLMRSKTTSAAGIKLMLAGALGLSGYFAHASHQTHQHMINQAQEHDQLYVPELGGYLPPDWAQYVQLARDSAADDAVLEEYWGIWSAIRRSQPLLPVDSAIHALGSVRDRAREVMADAPDTLITTLPAHSAWQSWSLSTNYWLYRPLLGEYSPVAASPHTLVWRRRDDPLPPAPLQNCRIDEDGSAVTVEVVHEGYVELHLEHTPVPGGRQITMLHTAIPYAAGADGWLALAPGSVNTLVPAHASEAGEHRFATRLTPASAEPPITIQACTYRPLAYSLPQALENLNIPFPVTDARWVNGVGRKRAALLVAAASEHFARLAPGAVVVFATDERRVVREAIDTGPWLEVLLDGPPLDATAMGFPHGFVVEHPEGVDRRPGAPTRLGQVSMACMHPDQR